MTTKLLESRALRLCEDWSTAETSSVAMEIVVEVLIDEASLPGRVFGEDGRLPLQSDREMSRAS